MYRRRYCRAVRKLFYRITMVKYKIYFAKQAQKDAQKIDKSEHRKKIKKLLEVLEK